MKKLNKPINIARRRFLKHAALGTAAGFGTAFYSYQWEPEQIQVVHHTLHLPGWPASAAGLKIGQLSDLHCQDLRSVARTVRAVQLLLAQKPDVVFLTGDYITDRRGKNWMPACAAALAPLKQVPRGVFASLGNHDWAGHQQDQVTRELEQIGFHVLRNQSAPLPGASNVWLVGMDSYTQNAQNPIHALDGVPKSAVKILLMHEPDYADEAPLGFALQVSGHSHAGQVRLPGLPPLHCPQYGRKYPEGLQQADHHLVYTTRGVGMMGPQIRAFCPPEVTILTIHPVG
jgi:predicted MPP superfamily phosphohydrolase